MSLVAMTVVIIQDVSGIKGLKMVYSKKKLNVTYMEKK